MFSFYHSDPRPSTLPQKGIFGQRNFWVVFLFELLTFFWCSINRQDARAAKFFLRRQEMPLAFLKWNLAYFASLAVQKPHQLKEEYQFLACYPYQDGILANDEHSNRQTVRLRWRNPPGSY